MFFCKNNTIFPYLQRDQLDRPVYTKMAPGKKDHVYKGRLEGEKLFEQKRYLLWPLKDLHEALNGKHEADDENSHVAKFGEVLCKLLKSYLKYQMTLSPFLEKRSKIAFNAPGLA